MVTDCFKGIFFGFEVQWWTAGMLVFIELLRFEAFGSIPKSSAKAPGLIRALL